MKRVLSLMLVLPVGILVTGCGNDSKPQTETEVISKNNRVNSQGFIYELDDLNKEASIVTYTKYTEELVIPSVMVNLGQEYKVTTIKRQALNDSGIEELFIPESIKNIEDEAFASNHITKLTIEGETTIGNNVFAGSIITELNIGGDYTKQDFNQALPTLGDLEIPGNKVDPNHKSVSITYTKPIEKISVDAFSRIAIRELNLHEGLVEVGSDAFSEAIYSIPSMNITKTLRLPQSLEVIGERAFKGVGELSFNYNITGGWKVKGFNELIIPENSKLREIQKQGLQQNLFTSFIAPKELKTIGALAFEASSELKTVVLGESVMDVGFFAFAFSDALEEVTIPKDIKLAPLVFGLCKNLNTVIGLEDWIVGYRSKLSYYGVTAADRLLIGGQWNRNPFYGSGFDKAKTGELGIQGQLKELISPLQPNWN